MFDLYRLLPQSKMKLLLMQLFTKCLLFKINQDFRSNGKYNLLYLFAHRPKIVKETLSIDDTKLNERSYKGK